MARRKQETAAPLKAIQSIERAKLGEPDQLNYDLFRRNAEDAAEGAKFRSEYLRVTQLDGPQQDIAQVISIAPHATVKDYQDILARLSAVPTLLEQTAELLKQGLAAGITPPRITLRDVAAQIQQQMVTDPAKSPLLVVFSDFPKEIPAAEQDRLRKSAEAVLKEKVVPAFSKLKDYFDKTYAPAARESIALNDLPDGKAWYAFLVRTSTTTSLTPSQIHELGLAEVDRIRAEMNAVIKQAGFKGDFAEFSKFLRTDPRFFYTDPEELMRGYRDIAKRADPELAKLFGKLPRLPYGVKAVPVYAESPNHRLLRGRITKSRTPGLVFREHVRTGNPAKMGDGTAHSARGSSRTSSPTLVSARTGGRTRIQEVWELYGVRGRLGALCREPGRRNGVLPGSV